MNLQRHSIVCAEITATIDHHGEATEPKGKITCLRYKWFFFLVDGSDDSVPTEQIGQDITKVKKSFYIAA